MRHHRGMTLIGMLLTTIIIIFLGITIMRIVPVYLQNYSIMRSIDALQALPSSDFSSDTSANAILLKNKLINQLDINGIDLPQGEMNIKPEDQNNYRISIKYKVVKPLVGNISLLFDFDESREVKISAE